MPLFLLELLEIAGVPVVGDMIHPAPVLSTGDPPEFIQIYKEATQAIEDDPSNIQAYFTRGVVCQSKGWLQQALADFVAVVKIDERHARAWLLMSEVLRDLGKVEQAGMARQQAMEIDPTLC